MLDDRGLISAVGRSKTQKTRRREVFKEPRVVPEVVCYVQAFENG
jgi:hypothetical protein